MIKFLITGATGNIGTQVIHYLMKTTQGVDILVAARDIQRAKKSFSRYAELSYRVFDFESKATFNDAFNDIEVLFLLRPPHISQVDTYFKPLIESAVSNGIRKIVFLSVQGAEKSNLIPHHKIELLIKAAPVDYIFVRPSYFMQNLTTTLLPEIQNTQTITLPSGNAIFNWIDVKNIGEAIAVLMHQFDHYKNQAIEITGSENKSLPQVVQQINQLTGTAITYRSVNPLRFYFIKKKSGLTHGFALAMTMIHFLQRFLKETEMNDNYYAITGNEPTSLKEFIKRSTDLFMLSK